MWWLAVSLLQDLQGFESAATRSLKMFTVNILSDRDLKRYQKLHKQRCFGLDRDDFSLPCWWFPPFSF